MKRLLVFVVWVIFLGFGVANGQIKVVNLKCEYLADAFDSQRVKSGQTTHVEYKGKTLVSARNYYWKVMVWDQEGKSAGWSEAAFFGTGLMKSNDWKGAQWIAWRPQNEWEKEWWRKKDIEMQCLEFGLPSWFEQYWNPIKLWVQSVWKYNQVKDKPGILTDVLSDWNSPYGNNSVEGGEVYSSMNFYLILKRLEMMAQILHKKEDAESFARQAETVIINGRKVYPKNNRIPTQSGDYHLEMK
ncbi:MAG: hypothetical protein WC865_02875 [Bacteroidales bacterium]